MRHTRERGQALAEFAIVVPVFMLLLTGMIQFGIILWGQNTLNQVVRDAGTGALVSDSHVGHRYRFEGGLIRRMELSRVEPATVMRCSTTSRSESPTL